MIARISTLGLLLVTPACFDPEVNAYDGSTTSEEGSSGDGRGTSAGSTTGIATSSGDPGADASSTSATRGEATSDDERTSEVADSDEDVEGTTWGDSTTSDASSGDLAEDSTDDPDTETDLDPVHALREGLALLLPMDEEAWTGELDEVRDASGRDNHGTPSGAATITEDGRFGRAGLFDGASWVEIADHTTLRPSNHLTMSAWVRPTDLGTRDSYGIFSKRDAFGASTSYTLYLDTNGHLTCDIQMEDDRFASEAPLVLDRWTHIAVVFDGERPESERVRMFVDGELERVAPETAETIDRSFRAQVRIGDLPGGGQPFIGKIDEVAIWTRALSDDEITLLAGLDRSLAAER